MFKNEKGEAELAVRATRDAKGFTNKPHKRSVGQSLPFLRLKRRPSDVELPLGHSMECMRICSRCTRTRSCLCWPSPWPTTPSKITLPSRRSRPSRPRPMGPYTIFEFGRSCTRCPFSGPCLLKARRERFNRRFLSAVGWSAWAIERGMKKIFGFTILGGRSWLRLTVCPAARGRWY